MKKSSTAARIREVRRLILDLDIGKPKSCVTERQWEALSCIHLAPLFAMAGRYTRLQRTEKKSWQTLNSSEVIRLIRDELEAYLNDCGPVRSIRETASKYNDVLTLEILEALITCKRWRRATNLDRIDLAMDLGISVSTIGHLASMYNLRNVADRDLGLSLLRRKGQKANAASKQERAQIYKEQAKIIRMKHPRMSRTEVAENLVSKFSENGHPQHEHLVTVRTATKYLKPLWDK